MYRQGRLSHTAGFGSARDNDIILFSWARSQLINTLLLPSMWGIQQAQAIYYCFLKAGQKPSFLKQRISIVECGLDQTVTGPATAQLLPFPIARVRRQEVSKRAPSSAPARYRDRLLSFFLSLSHCFFLFFCVTFFCFFFKKNWFSFLFLIFLEFKEHVLNL